MEKVPYDELIEILLDHQFGEEEPIKKPVHAITIAYDDSKDSFSVLTTDHTDKKTVISLLHAAVSQKMMDAE